MYWNSLTLISTSLLLVNPQGCFPIYTQWLTSHHSGLWGWLRDRSRCVTWSYREWWQIEACVPAPTLVPRAESGTPLLYPLRLYWH